MTIDSTKPVRLSSVREGEDIILIRHGVDNGLNFPVGTVVVEKSGSLRKATAAEVDNYYRETAREATQSNLRQKAGSLNSEQVGPRDVVDYLKAKFPEDFV